MVHNVASDYPLSKNEVISITTEIQNGKPSVWKISKCLIQSAAKLGNILRSPLNEKRLRKLADFF